MRIARHLWLYLTCLVSLIPSVAVANEDRVDYQAKVKPLLKSRCFACHGALKQSGGLRLDTAELIRKGGDSGTAIVPGEQAASSLLLERISAPDASMRMPPEHEGEPLKEDEILLLRNWIAAGAVAPADEHPEADPREHWSFRAVIRAQEPSVKNTAWVRNPIDKWIAAGHERQGLVPQPEASRIVLLRRLTMDLIGLPPTEEEIAAFEADTSPLWYEKTVNRLLDDPRHGERWARHWMDIWRYSDWWGLGDQLRNSDRHIWHWRDWIVESLNHDVPYDEMLRLMLAADELAPDDPDKLRATGFLVRNYYLFNRNKWMEDTVEHVSKAMLGLTMNCSKCHDHKFDPLSQVDYYRMRAFFEPYLTRIDMIPGETDFNQNGIPRVFDGLPEVPTYRFIRGDDAHPDTLKPIQPGVPGLFAFADLDIQPVDLPDTATQPGLRPWVAENYLALARQRLQSAEQKRQLARNVLDRARAEGATAAVNPASSTSFPPITETFEKLEPTRWRIDGAGWAHSSGKMLQTQDGPDHSTLTFLEQVPDNFKAELRFQIAGGSRWQSLGLLFDGTRSPRFPGDETETCQEVYLSASVEDPKVQVAFRQGGQWNYPGDGRKSLRVELGQEYTLQLRVRGTLINVALNGEHVLAYRTPVARRPGLLRIMTFDALAAIHEFQLSALDPSEPLEDAGGVSTANEQHEWELADADVKIAVAELESVETRMAAIEASRKHEDQALQSASKVAAVQAERRLALARAERNVLVADHAHQHAVAAKQNETQKNLDEARKKLSEAEKVAQAAVSPEESYTPFSGTRWTATRFRNTGSDDPQPGFHSQSTGRRRALAQWITDRRNPLTARAAVNHLWNRHFGTPLAPAPFDLGRNSPAPADPQLVDWLASEFVDQGWNMKTLHRLIVTSSTYRMGSSVTGAEENLRKDPDNRYWWRRTPIRIESQVVRDTILSLTGTLDPAMGGPSVLPAQQADSKRRSLYFFHSNNERNLFLTTFDEAEVGECYRREQSIVPQQALAMSNSGLVLDAARQIASRISVQSTDDTDFVRRAFALLLGIHPNDAEIAASREAIARWNKADHGSVEQSRANLIWILMNHNDFVTLR